MSEHLNADETSKDCLCRDKPIALAHLHRDENAIVHPKLQNGHDFTNTHG